MVSMSGLEISKNKRPGKSAHASSVWKDCGLMSWGRKGKYVAPSIPVFSGFFSHGNEDLSSSHGSSQKHMKFRDNTGGSQGKATESLLR